MLRPLGPGAVALLVFFGSFVFAATPERLLIELESVDLSKARYQDVKPTLATCEGQPCLRLASGHREAWPGISFIAPQGVWDLSGFGYVLVDVRNVGKATANVGCRLDTAGVDRNKSYIQATANVAPGQTTTLKVRLLRKLPKQLEGKLFGMRGFPGGNAGESLFDAANVDELRIFLAKPTDDHLLEVSNIRTGGSPPPPLPADLTRLFPMIDGYGQYVHKDWPGKIHNDNELTQRRQEEAADLKKHPGPSGWNPYGGWEAGPKLEATGFFRVEKRDGKWWLVDPEGRLFWSHGIDCVNSSHATTPITDRKHWFQALPSADSPFARFYGKGSWAPHGYYESKQYETYCFSEANLLRKYGADWQRPFAETTHQRLRSWGMNTIGNWSSSKIYGLRKTPYVVTVSGTGKPIEGSTGYWGKFPDPFDASLGEALRRHMAREKEASAGDPWCLGYFVGNELSWGDETSLALAALASPAEQAAKKAFVDELKHKYGSIDKLNGQWGTQHASWESLLENRTPPDKKKAYGDLTAFYSKIAEEYFRVCREAVKEAAPKQLYLGCRFAWVNPRAVHAAAKYCDVVSYNLYRYTIDNFQLPDGLDRPVIVGEFHFGALDRGMFHTGLCPVENQTERAEAYRRYLEGALRNPLIVGTHWFQYGDQATTGRGDGENYQIGFVDVCDTPYPETIAACREIGATMYRLRAEPAPQK
jgi:hypothetical protein